MLALAKYQRFSFSRLYRNFYNGDFVNSKSTKLYDIRNPVTQELVAQAPQSTPEEFDAIVANAKEAFKTWSRVPLMSNFSFIFSKTEIYV